MNTIETYENVVERRGHSGWYVAVVAIFVTTLIAANVTAVKLIDVFGLILPAGTIVFPISYIFGDVLTEVYGYRAARKTIWLAFACNLVFVAAVYGAQVIPPASFWDGQAAYERILGFTGRLLVASFCAYLVGEFVNGVRAGAVKDCYEWTMALAAHDLVDTGRAGNRFGRICNDRVHRYDSD